MLKNTKMTGIFSVIANMVLVIVHHTPALRAIERIAFWYCAGVALGFSLIHCCLRDS